MLIICQHDYSESKVFHLCGLRPHNLFVDCNPVLSTEPTGKHCESLTMLSYIELSFQAPSYDHNLLTRVYTLTSVIKFFVIIFSLFHGSQKVLLVYLSKMLPRFSQNLPRKVGVSGS